MIHPGMVSVSFRQLAVPDLIGLVKESGLKAVEWGSDIHVPPGDPVLAEDVRRRTDEAGLAVSSYGSYYRVGAEAAPYAGFQKVLDTAIVLRAPTIRVWGGDRGSAEADAEWRARVERDTRALAGRAAGVGIALALEYHGNTLTDTPESARDLFRAVNHPNVFSYWQANSKLDKEARLESLRIVTPWLSNLHVHHFEEGRMVALARGADEWRGYFAHAAALPGDRYALVEFVEDGKQEHLLRDAQTLRDLLSAN